MRDILSQSAMTPQPRRRCRKDQDAIGFDRAPFG
jgi:hypothetical protein